MLQFLERQIRDRPAQRSSRHTSTKSISRRAASSSLSRASRRAAPEFTPRTYMAIVQPRRAAYSRMARFCIAIVCCSSVDTGHTGQPGTCSPATRIMLYRSGEGWRAGDRRAARVAAVELGDSRS